MVCKKDDNSIFNSNQDRWGISYLSKHLSDVKRSHLLASAAKLIFCDFFPFLQYRRDIIQFLFFFYVNWDHYIKTFCILLIFH